MDSFARLLALPCLPYDYANSVYSDSIVQVVRTMAEIAPTETLGHLSIQVNESLDETKDFWQNPESRSRFLSSVEITGMYRYISSVRLVTKLLQMSLLL